MFVCLSTQNNISTFYFSFWVKNIERRWVTCTVDLIFLIQFNCVHKIYNDFSKQNNNIIQYWWFESFYFYKNKNISIFLFDWHTLLKQWVTNYNKLDIYKRKHCYQLFCNLLVYTYSIIFIYYLVIFSEPIFYSVNLLLCIIIAYNYKIIHLSNYIICYEIRM